MYKGGLQKTITLADLEEDLACRRSVWRTSTELYYRMLDMKIIV